MRLHFLGKPAGLVGMGRGHDKRNGAEIGECFKPKKKIRK
jgi:hypothetical protein